MLRTWISAQYHRTDKDGQRGLSIRELCMGHRVGYNTLEKPLIIKNLLCDGAAMAELLDEPVCLLLAVVKGAAYLNMNRISTTKYFQLL